jgi:hypothetical protein
LTRFFARNPWFAACLVLLLVGSCSKQVVDNPATPGASTATLTGIVFSLGGAGLPLAGAAITSSPASGASTTTNAQGMFTLTIPAGKTVAVGIAKAGFAAHPIAFNVAGGIVQSTALSVLPVAANLALTVANGGDIRDAGVKTVATFPVASINGHPSAAVRLTGLDPNTYQALALPGTFAARNLLSSPGYFRPVSAAELVIGDGLGTDYTLALPAQLELGIPVALQGLTGLGLGSLVECFRYDETSGEWKSFAQGTVVTSSVYGVPAVKVAVDKGGWYAAGFFDANTACLQGTVLSGANPAANADLQAFPGGLTRTDGSGVYSVLVPANATIQLVSSRSASGALSVGSAVIASGTSGGACLAQNVTLQPAGGLLTYVVHAQLMRGRDEISVPRHSVRVQIQANTSPTPTPVDAATVEINHGTGWIGVPRTGPGRYELVSGMGSAITLTAGANYDLRIDLESDGTFDATSTVRMPGPPVITVPTAGGLEPSPFTCTWNDPSIAISGYTARYIGSFESSSFGTLPSQFVVNAPGASKLIGDGVADAVNHMPNDLLVSGEYTFRLWATNGPVQYAVPGFLLFNTPNISGSGVIGWFSAISQADSVKFTSLGDGSRPMSVMFPAHRPNR